MNHCIKSRDRAGRERLAAVIATVSDRSTSSHPPALSPRVHSKGLVGCGTLERTEGQEWKQHWGKCAWITP